MASRGKQNQISRVFEAFLVSAGLISLIGLCGCQTHCSQHWRRDYNQHESMPVMNGPVWITEDGTPIPRSEMDSEPPGRASISERQPTSDSPHHAGPDSNGFGSNSITNAETPPGDRRSPTAEKGNPPYQDHNRAPGGASDIPIAKRNPIEVIEELGGVLSYDDEQQIVAVDLSESKVNNNQLRVLKSLKQLKQIKLNETKISNAGIVHLRGMTNLEFLMLNRTNVSDAGLRFLAGMTQLKSLGLSRTAVTDTGLVHLENLKNLRFLLLDRTQITDTGLLQLHGLTNLEGLALTNTRVTRAGVERLRRALPNCQIVFNQTGKQSALPLRRPSFRFLPDAPIPSGSTIRTLPGPTSEIVSQIIKTTRRHLQLGQVSEAEAGLTSLFRLRPADPVVLEALAQFYAAQGKSDVWCELLKEAVSSHADNRLVRFRLAVALGDAGNTVASFPHFVKTVGLAAAHYDVGVLDFRNGRIRIAKRHFERALKLDPRMKPADTWLNSILYPRRAKYVHSATYGGSLFPATGLAIIRPAGKLPASGQATGGGTPQFSNRFAPFGRRVPIGRRVFGTAASSTANPLGTISIDGNRMQNIPVRGPYKVTLQFGDAILTLDVKQNRANANEGNPLRVSNSRRDRIDY